MKTCSKTLAKHQGWATCGQTHLCEECGGPYRLKNKYRPDEEVMRNTNRYDNPINQRRLVRELKVSDNWIPWLYRKPVKDL